MTIRAITLIAFLGLLPTVSIAAEAVPPKAAPGAITTEQKREWLRRGLTGHLTNRLAIRNINAKLDAMSPRQIDELTVFYERQMAQAQLELQQAMMLQRQLQQQRYYNPNRIAYAPIVNWLPEGTSLGIGGVVSPDRRYVRVNATPFFSSIPRVDTFNTYTGETRRIYPRQPVQPPRVETWHDGTRTRVGYRH